MIVQWTVYASAIAGVLALTAWAVEAALRPRGWPVRWVWLAAMLLSLALPAARLAAPGYAPEPAETIVTAQMVPAPGMPAAEPVGAEPQSAAAPVTGTAASAVSPPATSARGVSLLARVEAAAPALWIAGSSALAALLLLAWAMLLRRARGWRRARVDGEPVLLSEDTGPAVIGVLRGSIVLPEWVLSMDAGERRLILRHERAHIAARDPLLVAAGMAAVVLAPWNPALWWQLRRLRLAIETDCDARVLGDRRELRGYARLLLALGERAVGALPPGSPAFSEPRSFLERRIRAMTAPRSSRRRGLAAGMLATALLPLWVYALPAPPPLRAAAPAVTLLPRTIARGGERAGVSVAVRAPGDTAARAQAAVDTVQARYEPTAVGTLAEREYPADMRALGVEGTVTLRFTIDPSGRARDPEAISQSGLEFVEPAKRVVQQLQFQPASYEGRPVEQSVNAFQVRFRLRPPAPVASGAPTADEVLLRSALERYYPLLLRAESARTPFVYFVVDERGNVLRRALDWSGPQHTRITDAIALRFPDLPRERLQASAARVATGIPGGREIRVYWAVQRQGTPTRGEIAWGPYPLAATTVPMVPMEVVQRVARERYPEILQRAATEGIWFVGHPDGEVLYTGKGRLPSSSPAARYWPLGGIVTFVEAAEGGATQVYWVTPQAAEPGEPDVVSGTVRDASGSPVAGAVILFRDRPLGGVTGADGRYAFRAAGLPAGSYTLLARHPAGAPAATREVALRPGASATADFTLPGR